MMRIPTAVLALVGAGALAAASLTLAGPSAPRGADRSQALDGDRTKAFPPAPDVQPLALVAPSARAVAQAQEPTPKAVPLDSAASKKRDPFGPIKQTLRFKDSEEPPAEPTPTPTPTPTPVPTPFWEIKLRGLIVSESKTMAVFLAGPNTLMVEQGGKFRLEGKTPTTRAWDIEFSNVEGNQVVLKDDRGNYYSLRIQL